MNDVGIGLVEIGRARGSEEQPLRPNATGECPHRWPGCLDGHGCGIFVVPGDRAVTFPSARSEYRPYF